jgi:ABC-type microcin C transport system permease subunit YejE
MLSRTIVFTVLTLFVFSILMAFIPIEFVSTSTGAYSQSAFVVTTLNANDVIVYKNQALDNMTHGYSSLEDAPDPPQWNVSLPTGEYLEVKWSQFPVGGAWAIELVHAFTT